jgi:hypothetical protein
MRSHQMFAAPGDNWRNGLSLVGSPEGVEEFLAAGHRLLAAPLFYPSTMGGVFTGSHCSEMGLNIRTTRAGLPTAIENGRTASRKTELAPTTLPRPTVNSPMTG